MSRFNLKAHEIRLIREAMTASGGNRRRAAEALGISTVSLWRKLKEHRLGADASST
jgi:transcriptional regulator with PAS, ATPase and Fis domain